MGLQGKALASFYPFYKDFTPESFESYLCNLKTTFSRGTIMMTEPLTESFLAADPSAVETAVLEMLSSWDEDYLCGCGLYESF